MQFCTIIMKTYKTPEILALQMRNKILRICNKLSLILLFYYVLCR